MYAHEEKYFAQHFSLVINKFQDFQMHPIFITQIVDARKYIIDKFDKTAVNQNELAKIEEEEQDALKL